MGRALLVCRLALRNVRRRPVEAALLVLAITAAATTLTLGLVMHGVTDHPYERTREATAGPDVVASVAPLRVAPNRVVPVDPSGLEALTDAPGVVDHSGPYPATVAELAVDGVTADTWVQGRDRQGASVDQPELTQGSWVEDGGAVVEAAFADALDVAAGDRITLDGRSFRIVGVAVTAASSYTDVCFGRSCDFQIGPEPDLSQVPPPDESNLDAGSVPVDGPPPSDDAGLVWLTRADARGLASAEGGLSYAVNLRLADPAEAPAFVAAHSPEVRDPLFLASWQDIRTVSGEMVRGGQEALAFGGRLLAVLAAASVAVLVGGRMADETRRVGLLKAAGGTPGLVAVVLLAEYIGLALVAAVAGLTFGWLAAPLLTDPGAGLVGSAGAPSLTASTVGQVTAVAVGVAAVAAVVPAGRAARTSTVHALADRARPPRRARWLIALSARLPAPLLLGVRAIGRHPRRTLLGIASIAVTVSGIVAVLTAHGQIATDWGGGTGLEDPVTDLANQVLLVITVMLVTLAAVNATVITWATALDARRSSALARALGATPWQVTAGLAAAQVLPALTGAVLGIPGGLALVATIDDEAVGPPLGQLLAVVAGTVLVVAGLTSVPARLAARRPTAQILQAERA